MSFLSGLSQLFTAAAIVAVDYLTLGAAAAYQMAITFAVSIVASRIFAPNVPQAQQNNIRQQVPPDPTAGIPLVYGDAYTGGRFCDAVLTTDQKSMYYVMVISCISPNGQFSFDTSKFYYQDQIITFDTTDLTKVVSLTDQARNVDTSISGHLYINLYTSSQTGTITPINTSNQPSAVMSTANGIPSGQEWVSSGRQMNGTAFAIVQLVYNANSLGTTALQPVTFHVSHYLNGAGCAKPGDVWYDYMTNTVYGAAVESQFVSSASATALNAYSDELITYTPAGGGSASIPRYRFNGVLDTGQTALSNIDLMMNCCDCWQSYQVSTGLWTAVINKAISPTFAFDDTNIISDITVGELDITQMINQIEARFVDSGNRDQPGYVNLQTPSGLLLPNEPVNKFTISYDLVNNSVTAQYLANRVLEQNRLDLIVSFSTNYTGIQVNAGDVVTVTNSYYGWSNQQFRVMQVKEVSLPDGSLGASLQMIQYDPNVYATSSITAYTPTSHSGLAAPTFFSSLAAPTVTAHFETANIPYFNVQVFVPVTGRVTNGTLYYTTVATPSGSDWKVWANVQTANSLPVPNNTYYTFVDVVLPAGTYYFAYTVGSGTSLSTLSPISAGFVWAPTGLSGVSGASGYSGFSGSSGYSGTQGNSFREGYLTQSQSAATPSVSPNPTTGGTSFPTGWSGTITTPAAGQSLWAIDGTYNPNTNQTTWSAPYLTQGFPTTIQSDNYVPNTSGWQIQRDTGNAYFNAISARGDISGASNINVSGQGIFSGRNTQISAIYISGTSYTAQYGVAGLATTSPTSSSYARTGVYGVSQTSGSLYNVGVMGQGVSYLGSSTLNGIGVIGSGDLYGGYFGDGGGSSAIGLVANHSLGNIAFYIPNGQFQFGTTYIQQPPNNTTTYLRGDGTWAPTSGITAGVSSFNTRTGAVTLSSSDVTTALGYTPGTGNGTVTSVSGSGSVSGLTLSGTVTTSGSITLGGSLTLTTAQLTATAPGPGYLLESGGWVLDNVIPITFPTNSGSATVTGNSLNLLGSTSTGIAGAYIGTLGSGNTVTFGVQTTSPSDIRLKEEIADIDVGLDFVKKLRPVSYKLKADPRHQKGYGFIADEVEPLVEKDTSLVYFEPDWQVGDQTGFKTIHYPSYVAVLTKAIQELSSKCDALQAKIDTMTTK